MRIGTRAWEAAVRSFGIEPTPRIRPNALRWLWYALWGPLPDRHRFWVLYDATCSTWVLRYFARILVIAAPPAAAIAVLLPGPPGLSVLTAFAAGGLAFFLTAIWVNEATEYRLVQAGWRWDTGPALRERRSAQARQMADAGQRQHAVIRRRRS